MSPKLLQFSGNYLLCIDNRVYKFKIQWCSKRQATNEEYREVMRITEDIARFRNLPMKILSGKLILITKIGYWSSRSKALSVLQFRDEKPGSLAAHKHSYSVLVFTDDDFKEHGDMNIENNQPTQSVRNELPPSHQMESVQCEVNNRVFHEEFHREKTNIQKSGASNQEHVLLQKQEEFLKESCEFNEISNLTEEVVHDLCKGRKEHRSEAVSDICYNKMSDRPRPADLTEIECTAHSDLIGSSEEVHQESRTELETSEYLQTKDSLNMYKNSFVDPCLNVNREYNSLYNNSGNLSSSTGHENNSQEKQEKDIDSSVPNKKIHGSRCLAENNKLKEEDLRDSKFLSPRSGISSSSDDHAELLTSISNLNSPESIEVKVKEELSMSDLQTTLCNIPENFESESPGYGLSLVARSVGTRELFNKEVLKGSSRVSKHLKKQPALKNSPKKKKGDKNSNNRKGPWRKRGVKYVAKCKRRSTNVMSFKKQHIKDVILRPKYVMEPTPTASCQPKGIETFFNIAGDTEGKYKAMNFLTDRMESWLISNDVVNRLKAVYEERNEQKITQINKYLIKQLRSRLANDIFTLNNPVVKCEPKDPIVSDETDCAEQDNFQFNLKDVQEAMNHMQIESLESVAGKLTPSSNSDNIEEIKNIDSVWEQTKNCGESANQVALQNSKDKMEAIIGNSSLTLEETRETKNTENEAVSEICIENTESAVCRVSSVVTKEDNKTNKTLDVSEPETTDETQLAKMSTFNLYEMNAAIKSSPSESVENPERHHDRVVYLFTDRDGCGVFTKASMKQEAVPSTSDFPTKGATKYTVMYFDEVSVPNISHTTDDRAAIKTESHEETNNADNCIENSIIGRQPLLNEDPIQNIMQTVHLSPTTDTGRATSINCLSSTHNNISSEDPLIKECLKLKLLEDCRSSSTILALRKTILQQGILERLSEQVASTVSDAPSFPLPSQNVTKPHFASSLTNRWKSDDSQSVASDMSVHDSNHIKGVQRRLNTQNALSYSEREEEWPDVNKTSDSVRTEVGVVFSSGNTEISLSSVISKDTLRSHNTLMNCVSGTDSSPSEPTSAKKMISLFIEKELISLYQYCKTAHPTCQRRQLQGISTATSSESYTDLSSVRVSRRRYSLDNGAPSDEELTSTISYCKCPPSVKFQRMPSLFSVMKVPFVSNSRMKLFEMFEKIKVQEKQKSNFFCRQHCFYFQVDEEGSVEGFYTTAKKYCSALGKFHNQNYSSAEFRKILLRDIWLPDEKHCLSFYTNLPMQSRKCRHCGLKVTVELCLNCGKLFECNESGNYVPFEPHEPLVSSHMKPTFSEKSSAVLNLINDLQLCKAVVSVESLKKDKVFSDKNNKSSISKE